MPGTTILLSLPCLVAFFWAILFFCERKENTRSQNIWILCLLMMGICTLIWGDLFIGVKNYSFYYILDIVDAIFSLSTFPMVYLYFWSLTSDRKLTWKQYIWFAPALIVGGISAVIYLLMGDEQSTDFIRKVIESRETYPFEPGSLQWFLSIIGWDVFYIILFFQVVIIMSYATWNELRYRRGLKNFFSNLDEKSIENNRAVLIGYYVMLLLALVVFFAWLFTPGKYYTVQFSFMPIAAVTIFVMSRYVFKMKFTAGNIIPEMEQEAKELINPPSSPDTYKKLLPLFVKLIEEDKIYLQPNITLEEIARQVNSNRTYISRIINEEFHTNFHDFINSKRIEYAKMLALQNPLFTQEQIAKESGFLHASNFSRVFKSQTDTTFREWQNNK